MKISYSKHVSILTYYADLIEPAEKKLLDKSSEHQ